MNLLLAESQGIREDHMTRGKGCVCMGLLISLYFMYVYECWSTCMSGHHMGAWCLPRLEGSGNGVTDSWEPPCECWGSLLEQLTSEPVLQSLSFFLKATGIQSWGSTLMI